MINMELIEQAHDNQAYGLCFVEHHGLKRGHYQLIF